MSKINNYQNNKNRNNNYHKRNNRATKVNPNEFRVPLYLSADLDQNISEEILEVLANTKFNKISIPVGTYRYLIYENVDADDRRVSTIGYIRNFNPETEEFTIVVFGNSAELVRNFGDIAIELQFTQYNNSLGTITKFNIIPVIYEIKTKAEMAEVVETDEEVFTENPCDEESDIEEMDIDELETSEVE